MPSLQSILEDIGSVFKPSFDIEQEKQLLYKELRSIADLKERLAHDPVWIAIVEVWKRRVNTYESDILRLSGQNVKKNAAEIEWKAAIRRGLIDLFDIIEKTLAEEPTIISKIQNIEETIRRYGETSRR